MPDAAKSLVTSGLYVSPASFETPGWLVSADNCDVLRKYDEGGMSNYYASLAAVDDESPERLAIESESPFRGIDLNLVGAYQLQSAEVSATFHTADGDRYATSSSLHTDPAFSLGSTFPVQLTAPEPAVEAEVTVEIERTGGRNWLSGPKAAALNRLTHRTFEPTTDARVGMPALRRQADRRPPIVLVSIDSLRYDTREQLRPLLEELGDDATVPAEPRTKGHWTPPSHASMFTGLHPGDHGYLAASEGADRPIHPEATTVPELLAERGYKCSALVSRTRLLPEFGFGRGFYRFQLQRMSNWLDREHDARTNVDQLLEWIETDARSDTQGLFYFLHVFDPHMPYVPPLPDDSARHLDLAAIDQFRSTMFDYGSSPEAIERLRSEVAFDDELVDALREQYEASVRYTARQLRRLVQGLRNEDLFDDALIVVTGDHGEEFGESGMFLHKSLYDANLRPFLAVKPPKSADWTVPDAADTIDFLPTIAREAGADVPEHCQGDPWQVADTDRDPRITERIQPGGYHVAVEVDDTKAIFTYPENYPERPTTDQVADGPVREEYYHLPAVREDGYEDGTADLSASTKRSLRDEAESFVRQAPVLDRQDGRVHQPAEETKEQLRNLGYR